jgi:hypothetical protein
MKLPRITVQNVVAILALCISFAAAIFAWLQIEVSREHNRKSVTPILHITPYAEGKGGRNGIYLSNSGLGPAIIKKFSVKSGSTSANGFELDKWSEVLRASNVNSNCFATGWPKSDAAVRAGIEESLLYVTNSEYNGICNMELVKLIGGQGVEISIEYESIYGELRRVSASSKIKSESIELLYSNLFGK